VARRRLSAPVQLPAATARGADLILAGGLSAADTSLDRVTVVTPASVSSAAALPEAIHDAAAATLGTRAYVLGGGEPSHAEIRPIGTGLTPTLAGQLPTAASDVEAATIDDAIYTVGGYDGTAALDTITRWSGRGTANVAGRLPAGVRYAAVTAADGRLIVAGGTVAGTASRAILSFDPASGAVRRVGLLPRPLTHASAAALGGTVYVFGGRGTDQGTQTAAILSVDPLNGRVRSAGRLPAALSDTGAATVGGRILVAGGREPTGTVSDGILAFGPSGRP
jgi:hypothetical protein